jgi:hypothetical protein
MLFSKAETLSKVHREKKEVEREVVSVVWKMARLVTVRALKQSRVA